MTDHEKLRIDKYLWAIRMFKTRSLATDACKAGRIKLGGQNVKASYVVKVGDICQISKGPDRKTIEVVELQQNRTDAKIAVTKYKDITPEEETQAFKSMFHAPILKRERGAGRPTKKDRRDIGDLMEGE